MKTALSHTEPVLHAALGCRAGHTANRGTRTGRVALALAQAFGISGDQLTFPGTAARLHDVGKPGSLDAAAVEIMRTHSEIGERILRADTDLPWRDEIAPIVRHHHEHYDGGGYPDRLSGNAIPILSRIVAVADSHDAMTERRHYRGRPSHQEVMAIVQHERGNKHDPQIVDLAVSMNEQWFADVHEN